MKFAKELEDGRVAEWQEHYLNYKQGKKRIKAVVRAIRNASSRPSRTPRSQTHPSPSLHRLTASSHSNVEHLDPAHTPKPIPVAGQPRPSGDTTHAPGSQEPEPGLTRYGSILGSPPSTQTTPAQSRASSLHLPDPALEFGSDPRPSDESDATSRPIDDTTLHEDIKPPRASSSVPPTRNAYEVGQTKHPSPLRSSMRRARSTPQETGRLDDANGERPLLQRIFSRSSNSKSSKQKTDIPLEAQREIDARKDDFWHFLSSELSKIETFYKGQENEATDRMNELRDQLHMLRDQRLREIREARVTKHAKAMRDSTATGSPQALSMDGVSASRPQEEEMHGLKAIYKPFRGAARHVHFRDNSANADDDSSYRGEQLADSGDGAIFRDYTRKPRSTKGVRYHDAKKLLKAALQEHYRGLELLKSYVLFNRTAFRKINKKYDKAARSRPYMSFVTEKVNEAWFVKSDVLDSYIHLTEDLYARYFERGNRKVAIGKLRKKDRSLTAYSASSFRDGVLAAVGLVLSIQGLVKGVDLLYDTGSGTIFHEHTSYLLQLYAGYFLPLYLMLLFCLICYVFKEAKINYIFIFEFDARHNLDWKQLAELPCALLFLLGLVMWMNFSQYGGSTMYIYYPVLLIGLSLLLLGFPSKTLYFRSRLWFWKALFRVAFLSGLVRVEFRDLMIGDMFNSLTYSMGNIELFFCLYAHHWNNPGQCNSSHSMLFGFFQTLPGIWRLAQCLYRWYTSGRVFPHLANAGKYFCTILAFMTLSLWRLQNLSDTRLAVFILFSCINSVYTSVWDIFMDWSLGTPSHKHFLLRDTLALKRVWWYYAAIVVDIVLRCSWVFYVIFRHDAQHSAVNSFAIGFFEVTRRAMWTIIRIENDHCSNVGSNIAIRDVPLPYQTASSDADPAVMDHERTGLAAVDSKDSDTSITTPQPGDVESRAGSTTTGAQISRQASRDDAVTSLRRRQTTQADSSKSPSIRTRVGELLSAAHADDFERTRRDIVDAVLGDEDDDDDDDDEDPGIDEDAGDVESDRASTVRDGQTGRRRDTNDMVDSGDEAEEQEEQEDMTDLQAVVSAKDHVKKAR